MQRLSPASELSPRLAASASAPDYVTSSSCDDDDDNSPAPCFAFFFLLSSNAQYVVEDRWTVSTANSQSPAVSQTRDSASTMEQF